MNHDQLPDNPYLLLTPGPLSTTKSVKAAMLKDWCTWDDDYNSIVQEVRRRLEAYAGKSSNDYSSVLMQGSGTFSIEAMIGSVVPRDGKLLCIGGTADALPFGAGTVGNVVCGQAFHWCRPHAAAVREAHRVLAPGGTLALAWNTRTPHCGGDGRHRWLARLERVLDGYYLAAAAGGGGECGGDGADGASVPRQQSKEWREPFDAPDGAARALFSPLQEFRVRWAQRMDDAALVDRVFSISVLARLEGRARDEALARVRALVETREDDELPYETELYWCNKL